jgi:predicted small lipoprotein YifL
MQSVQTLKIAVSFLLAVILTGLTGCGTRHLTLYYPPEASTDSIQQSPVIENPAHASPRVCVLEVFDARTEKNRLSNETSGGLFGIVGPQRVVFATEDDVADWVHDAVAYELNEAGYSVISNEGKTLADSEIELTVDIQKVFGVVNIAFEAEVLLQVTLQRENETTLTRQYEGNALIENLWDSGKTFAKTLALALQDAISKMLVDFELK